jgi:hypothetical protein
MQFVSYHPCGFFCIACEHDYMQSHVMQLAYRIGCVIFWCIGYADFSG